MSHALHASRPALAGVWVAIVTPFVAHAPATSGSALSRHAPRPAVDHAALRRLVQRLKQADVSGLVALGSTGEAAALDDDEQDAVLATVLQAAEGLPVIAGLAGNHQAQVMARLERFNTLPLHALLCPAPYYTRPSQAGLQAWFTMLADASRAPIVLYDIPYRTGVPMELGTLLALASHPNIVGIKDCGGSLDKTQRLIADGRLQVLAGEDNGIFHTLCLGGAGAITAAAQVAPEGFMAMYQALRDGHLAEGRAWQHRLAPLIHALFAEPNPSVIKAALQRQGLIDDELRAPMLRASESARSALTAVPAT